MTYSLYRDGDGAGDSGPMSMIARLNPEAEGGTERLHGEAPRVGWNVTVGAIGSRTYAMQDYWMTTPVTEIVSDITEPVLGPDGDGFAPQPVRRVVFKTRSGSTYTWMEF